ncbi:hypothetical protein N7533_009651 [Penicillium manginii]|uniref:uncharacterized protein n=1 Tax=Penicillium manginii TaxID=203109 RepID=UPI00254877B8|nr:uncharacterized protein N7533_009651 [Penicillium manginii]KAJ5744781.1 hypothetical protein N7533_009651 [Penicillium manginii]
MTTSPRFYEQPQGFDWLDAMSRNKAFYDPRTIEVNTDAILAPRPRLSSCSGGLTPRALAALPSTDHKAVISKWAQETSDSPIRKSGDDNNTDTDFTENDESDVASVTSSTVCTSIDSDIQLEAKPPFPQQRPATSALFDLRTQICQAGDPKKGRSQTACAKFAEDDYMYSPFEDIEIPSMALSSTVSASSFTASTGELNIGKLLAGKVRQVVSHRSSACKKFKKMFKH